MFFRCARDTVCASVRQQTIYLQPTFRSDLKKRNCCKLCNDINLVESSNIVLKDLMKHSEVELKDAFKVCFKLDT
jgi:hypothetical protein